MFLRVPRSCEGDKAGVDVNDIHILVPLLMQPRGVRSVIHITEVHDKIKNTFNVGSAVSTY